tara:strand:- start:67 stop:300 length:234 start_codon:yes stop_codon:yes gene_type:complete
MKFETEFLVFDVSKGPKIIVENLNTYGEQGWELKSMINVAGEKLVAFLQRQTDVEEPKDKSQEKLKSLWSANGEKNE